jgi:hypothetical protein
MNRTELDFWKEPGDGEDILGLAPEFSHFEVNGTLVTGDPDGTTIISASGVTRIEARKEEKE